MRTILVYLSFQGRADAEFIFALGICPILLLFIMQLLTVVGPPMAVKKEVRGGV